MVSFAAWDSYTKLDDLVDAQTASAVTRCGLVAYRG